MQKIAISALAYDGGRSGIANYIENVVQALSPYASIDLIVNHNDQKFFEGISENIKFKTVPSYLQKPLVNMLWHLLVLPFKLWQKKYDWIFLPAGNRRLMAFYPAKTLVTMHDLSQFHVSNKYDSFRMFYIKKIIPFFLKRADRILTVSGNTADDLVRFYGMDKKELIVNYNGVNTNNYSLSSHHDEKIRLNDKPYILYVARIEHPGKNHLNLIKAYEQLDEKLKEKYDLVLIGGDWNGAQTVHQYAEQSADSERIRFLGYVANDALPQYYRQASLFVFPSFYEGFGIPMVEAMASATPVAASNTSSLPEVGGDAALYFDPKDPMDISNTMTKILSSEECGRRMREAGLEQVKKFDWDKHAQILLEAAGFAK